MDALKTKAAVNLIWAPCVGDAGRRTEGASVGFFAVRAQCLGIPLEGNVVNQSLTWTWWEPDAGSPNAWKTLEVKKYGRGVLEDLVNSGAFFARKFPQGADVRRFGLHVYGDSATGAR